MKDLNGILRLADPGIRIKHQKNPQVKELAVRKGEDFPGAELPDHSNLRISQAVKETGVRKGADFRAAELPDHSNLRINQAVKELAARKGADFRVLLKVVPDLKKIIAKRVRSLFLREREKDWKGRNQGIRNLLESQFPVFLPQGENAAVPGRVHRKD